MERLSKGNRVNIPEPEQEAGTSCNANDLGDVGVSPGKSSLFFLMANITLKSV